MVGYKSKCSVRCIENEVFKSIKKQENMAKNLRYERTEAEL